MSGRALCRLQVSGISGTFAEAVAGPAAIAGARRLSCIHIYTCDDRQLLYRIQLTPGLEVPTAASSSILILRSHRQQIRPSTEGSGRGPGISLRRERTVQRFLGNPVCLSSDSIVTSVNCNGMAPYVFTIACNQWGCYNGNFVNDRRSVGGNHIIPQYRIFLNNPDSLVYPTGVLGQVVPPVIANSFCDGTAVIELTVNKAERRCLARYRSHSGRPGKRCGIIGCG